MCFRYGFSMEIRSVFNLRSETQNGTLIGRKTTSNEMLTRKIAESIMVDSIENFPVDGHLFIDEKKPKIKTHSRTNTHSGKKSGKKLMSRTNFRSNIRGEKRQTEKRRSLNVQSNNYKAMASSVHRGTSKQFSLLLPNHRASVSVCDGSKDEKTTTTSQQIPSNKRFDRARLTRNARPTFATRSKNKQKSRKTSLKISRNYNSLFCRE